MKQLGISIIGTDTDVGKTFVTGLLGAMAVDDGFAVGMVRVTDIHFNIRCSQQFFFWDENFLGKEETLRRIRRAVEVLK